MSMTSKKETPKEGPIYTYDDLNITDPVIQQYVKIQEMITEVEKVHAAQNFQPIQDAINAILADTSAIPAKIVLHSVFQVIARIYILQPDRRNMISKFIAGTSYKEQFKAALASNLADPLLQAFLTDTIGPNMQAILLDDPYHIVANTDIQYDFCSITDDLRGLQKKFGEITDEHHNPDVEAEIYSAAMFGSVQCFKFLWANEIRPDQYIIVAAIIGGNKEIIHILEQNDMYAKFFSASDVMTAAVHAHRNNLVDWLIINHKKQSIDFDNALYALNIKALATLKFPEHYGETMFKESISRCNIPAAIMSGKMKDHSKSLCYSYTVNLINQFGPDLAIMIINHFGFEIDAFSMQINIENVTPEYQAAFIQWFYLKNDIFTTSRFGDTILNSLLSPRCSVEAFKAAIQIQQTVDYQRFLDIMNKQHSERSLIIQAARIASLQKIQILFNNGADPNVESPYNERFLYILLRSDRKVEEKVAIATWFLTRFAGSSMDPGKHTVNLNRIVIIDSLALFMQYVKQFKIKLTDEEYQKVLKDAKFHYYNSSITKYIINNKLIKE